MAEYFGMIIFHASTNMAGFPRASHILYTISITYMHCVDVLILQVVMQC